MGPEFMIDYYDPGFCGTENYWQHLFGFRYVDSVKYFCETKKAYWVLDLIGSYVPTLRSYSFLVLFLDVEEGKARFSAKEDLDMPDVVSQNIEYTDLDLSIRLYWEGGVIIFPSDH
jgi:hypothetical protein